MLQRRAIDYAAERGFAGPFRARAEALAAALFFGPGRCARAGALRFDAATGFAPLDLSSSLTEAESASTRSASFWTSFCV